MAPRNPIISETEIEGFGRCYHKQYGVKVKTREVVCSLCGKVLDPFDILREYAEGERNYKGWAKSMSKVRKDLEDMKAEEKRVKARLRNAKKKDAEAAVNAARKKDARAIQEALHAMSVMRDALRKAQIALPGGREYVDESSRIQRRFEERRKNRPRCKRCNRFATRPDPKEEKLGGFRLLTGTTFCKQHYDQAKADLDGEVR